MGRGVDGIPATGVTVLESVSVGRGRGEGAGACAVVDDCSLPETKSGVGLDTKATVTRVPALPDDEPDEVAELVGACGFMLEVAPDNERNVLLAGIGGTVRAP